MNRYEQNPYVRKHVHRWAVIKTEQPSYTGYDVYGPTPRKGAKFRMYMTLTRECGDCGKRQEGEVLNRAELVKGYEAIADLNWKDV